MKHPETRLEQLLSQYIRGELPETEQPELWEYVQNPVFEEKIKHLLAESFERETEPVRLDQAQQQALLASIFQNEKPTSGQAIVRKIWTRVAVAAALLCALTLGVYFYMQQTAEKTIPLVDLQKDIPPGQYTATLTLSDGSQIQLSDKKIGAIADESGIQITQTDDGSLIYTIPNTESVKVGWNTLSTKNGETYQVQLPDGTAVWLNAGSSLSYPTSFLASNQRHVKLEGEAYFEVAKNQEKPFRVNTAHQTVEVLGTHFNINSYTENADASTTTTLVEGRVRVYKPNEDPSQAPQASVILKPGEQAIDQQGHLRIQRAVDLEAITSWKDGYFKFNENLEGILAKVARWYDIKIEYQYRPPAYKTFSGKISRDKPLSDLLTILSYNGDVHFKVEGRRVIVMQ